MKKKLHIIYIITKLELGGAQKVCLSLFKHINTKNIVTHLISGKKGPLVHEIQSCTHSYLLSSMERRISFFSFKELRNFILVIKLLRSIKKKYHHCIVHTHSTKAGLIGRWAAFFAGIHRRVHTVHGFGFHSYQNKIFWLINFSLEWLTSFITTHYICVSDHDLTIGTQCIPFFKKKSSLIRAAVYNEAFIPAIHTKNHLPFIFGTVACFKHQKNIFDLLRAFNKVHAEYPETYLEIIGDGILRPQYEQWIQAHALSTHILLHGWHMHPQTIMQRWHAFTLTSLWEGLPCAIIEARLLKLPVLAYRVGGIDEVIIPNRNGLLYQPKDWHNFAEGMKQLVTNHQLFNSLITYQDNLSSFTRNHMITQHIQLYKELANTKESKLLVH